MLNAAVKGHLQEFMRAFSTTQALPLVLGMGSNVVDLFHRVRKVPPAGSKGYFANPSVLEASAVGGVTLNHLGWAAVMGVPTGLLALQGDDAIGKDIRKEMKNLGISQQGVVVSPKYSSSVSLIFLEEGGERCIIMAPAATSQIDSKIVHENFSALVNSRAAMITTEISQVPVSGVQALLNLGKKKGVTTMIDVDVPPSVAESEAKLGTVKEVCDAVMTADVVKPTLESATELLAILDPKGPKVSPDMPLDNLAARLVAVLKCKVVAITDGKRGAALASPQAKVAIPCFPVSKVVDTTGAGDAFFGGLIAGIYHWGVPSTADELKKVGQLSAATGAVCVQYLGALPNSKQLHDVVNYVSSVYPVAAGILDFPQTAAPASSPASSSIIQMSLEQDLKAIQQQLDVAEHNSGALDAVVKLLLNAKTLIFSTGLGKSGVVASRLATSLSSVSVPTEYVHATEWFHGELGKIQQNAVVIAFSHSGRTAELLTLAPMLKQRNARLIAVTSDVSSPLAVAADYVLLAPIEQQSEPFGLVPTSSIIAQETVVNVILRSLIAASGFKIDDFRFNHPGGAIGQSKK